MAQFPAASRATGHAAMLVAGNEPSGSNEYLIFCIDLQFYAVEILSVREIRAWIEVTALPNTPEFVRGIINLRGTVVPIYDLRVRFGGGRTSPTSLHVVIVVEAANGTFGLLVDSVSDILSIEQKDLQPVPDTGADANSRFLAALVARADRMVSVLDLDRLVNQAAAAEMEKVVARQSTTATGVS